jgi:hypothetical protein
MELGDDDQYQDDSLKAKDQQLFINNKAWGKGGS